MPNLKICTLSSSFFQKYPDPPFSEIERKPTRPYSCLVFPIFPGLFVCVPFRSHIPHNNAFLFRNSKRSQKSRSGIDYSKLVIISDISDISSKPGIVDKDEYNEASIRYKKIEKDVEKYIMSYMNHITGQTVLAPADYSRKYKFSTLPYFESLLLPFVPKQLTTV